MKKELETSQVSVSFAKRYLNELGLIAAVIVVVGFTMAFNFFVQDQVPDYYSAPIRNLRDVLRETSLLGIFTLGAAIVIISGGIDLSSGSVIVFTGSICGLVMMVLAPKGDDLLPDASDVGFMVVSIAIVATLISGLMIGTVHAWLITIIRLPPFVATLASLVGLRSLAKVLNQAVTLQLGNRATSVRAYDEMFAYLGEWWVPPVVFIALSLLCWFMMNGTVVGRHLYAMGGNEEAARLSGIRTDLLKWMAYSIGSVTAAVAGILYTAKVGSANPSTLAVGYELNAIAASVVGGCSLQGGAGLIPGVMLGVLFLRVVIDSVAKIVKTGSDDYQGLIVGFLVVLAVAFNELRRKSTGSRHDFFPGILGAVTIPILATLVGVVIFVMFVLTQEANGVVPGIVTSVVVASLLGAIKFVEMAPRQESLIRMDPKPDALIEVHNVTKRYPGVVALSEVSFEVRHGELHSICGENGAGKSTLMKILSGVITDYEGEVRLRGERVHFRGTRDAEAAGISIIHQELNLVEELSAAANVFLGREHTSTMGLLNNRRMNAETSELLSDLECTIHPQVLAGSLRVGDQQLLEIAKALSLSTDILIMDEPTSALTEAEVERLYRVIDRLRSKGVTILYISHKMDEVFRISDRITVLRDGRLVRTLNRDETSARQVTHLMVGREIEEIDLDPNRSAGEVILDVRNLSLAWPGHAREWRLKDISFALRRGEILGIAGLMGAGRTELLECLFGASEETPKGEIFLDDRQVRFRSPNEARRAGVAMVTEDRKRLGIFAQMCVRENISICTLDEAVMSGIISRNRESALANESIARLSVKTSGCEAAITSLSGGNQQKTIIGRWLLTNPKVLLLDDPTRGVDVGAKAELYRLMDALCRDGIAVVLTSSELPELLTVCDRILVLAEGRLTAEFDRKEATEQKIMEAATNS